MADLAVNMLGVAFESILFSGVTFNLSGGERLGVVGNNASGKTTFLECLVGRQEPTTGSVRTRKGLRTVLVEQQMPADHADMSFTEVLLSGLPDDERLAMGWRADFVLESFATPDEMRDRPLGNLSGGWQKLAMIGRA